MILSPFMFKSGDARQEEINKYLCEIMRQPWPPQPKNGFVDLSNQI